MVKWPGAETNLVAQKRQSKRSAIDSFPSNLSKKQDFTGRTAEGQSKKNNQLIWKEESSYEKNDTLNFHNSTQFVSFF